MWACCILYNPTFPQPNHSSKLLMDSLIQLPRINLSDLQKKILSRHNSMPFRSTIQNRSIGIAEEIHVTSPFYDKIKHTNKCQCPHHRLKKYQEKGSKIRPAQKQVIIINLKPHNNLKFPTVQKKASISNHPHPQLPEKSKATTKMKPLERKTCEYKSDKAGPMLSPQKKIAKEVKNNSNGEKTGKVSNIDWSKCSASNLRDQFEDIKFKINNSNSDFMAYLSKRLQNNKYKEKYIKALFRFIKMKTNENKLYMWDSKAYIQNSINVLLNHYHISALTGWDSLTPQQVQKIAYHMACSKEKVPKILKDLKAVVHNIEQHLEHIRKKQKIQNQLASKLNSISQLDKMLQQEHQQETISMNYLTRQKLTDGSDKENQSIQCIGDGDNTYLKTYKETHKSFRKSVLQMDFQSTNKFRQKDELIGQMKNQTECSEPLSAAEEQFKRNDRTNKSYRPKIRRNRKRSSTKQKSTKSCNPYNESSYHSHRSTFFLGTVDERELQSGEKQKRRDSRRVSKNFKASCRKGQFVKKIFDMEYDAKYKHIPYQEFCSKSQFISLIDELQRLDKNPSEKAQIVYKLLRLDRWFEKPQRLEELLKVFEPLMNEVQRKQIIKHTVALRDKRYIQKLTKEMDMILLQIKKTDPRELGSQDLCPYKMDPSLREPKHIRFTKYQGYGVYRPSGINTMKDYQAHDKIEKLINQSPQEELEQRELPDIMNEPIGPDITEQVNYRKLKCEATDQKNISIDQKKILQYMHRHHNSTFKYLNNQMSQFCASLPEDRDISYRA